MVRIMLKSLDVSGRMIVALEGNFMRVSLSSVFLVVKSWVKGNATPVSFRSLRTFDARRSPNPIEPPHYKPLAEQDPNMSLIG
jgi:hypothetical protein